MFSVNSKFFLGFFFGSIYLVILIILFGCSTIPGAETRNANNVLLSDITSLKWKGTATIPRTALSFADEGVQRVNCFGFTSADNSGVATYEWKSDIYTNDGPPNEVYFHHENTTAGMDFTPILNDVFFFVIRYNTINNGLSNQYAQTDSRGNHYSVWQPLLSIDNITGRTNFNGLSIYMPVYVRNINIASSAGGVSTLEMNFGIGFTAAKTTDPQKAISSIASDLNGRNAINVDGFLRDYWVNYATVSSIESGANGCPNF